MKLSDLNIFLQFVKLTQDFVKFFVEFICVSNYLKDHSFCNDILYDFIDMLCDKQLNFR